MTSARAVQLGPGLSWLAARTPTLPPATHTNSFALGAGQILLVEPATPYAEEQRAWLDWARGLDSAGAELVGILVTHHHIDHVAGIELLARGLGLPLWAHAETAARLDGVEIARLLEDGEAIELEGPTPQCWQVLHTPGHAPGHLCLHEPSLRVALVGDMVASEGTILIDPSDGDLGQYLEQLERLERLDARLALPAHGAPIEEPSKLFRRYITHRRMREDKVVAALDAFPEGGTLGELVARAYDDTPQALWPLAERSLESHLLELERRGRAESLGPRWRPPAGQSRGRTET